MKQHVDFSLTRDEAIVLFAWLFRAFDESERVSNSALARSFEHKSEEKVLGRVLGRLESELHGSVPGSDRRLSTSPRTSLQLAAPPMWEGDEPCLASVPACTDGGREPGRSAC